AKNETANKTKLREDETTKNARRRDYENAKLRKAKNETANKTKLREDETTKGETANKRNGEKTKLRKTREDETTRRKSPEKTKLRKPVKKTPWLKSIATIEQTLRHIKSSCYRLYDKIGPGRTSGPNWSSSLCIEGKN
ncbi:MAG: hypothetical protein OXR72_06635, partial [Gemmatimonadota bacterium]|nr:hypothetical protein [Gemmatimonadota bacterium]